MVVPSGTTTGAGYREEIKGAIMTKPSPVLSMDGK